VAASDETIRQLRSDYDAVSYDSRPYRQTHPDRLAAEAALYGFVAPSVENCRVLEIGCASGGNLIPMAEQLPQSRFVGIDLSSQQVAAGADVIRELGLTNVELRFQDLMEFPEDAGTFDYIIAHGFYAWVPPAVQQRLLEVCRTHLSPRGLAYISYNTYPGSKTVEVARGMMMFHARRATDHMEKAARGREILRFMTENTPNTRTYREVLRTLQMGISKCADRLLLHDQMSAVLDPQYFWQFIEQATGHGLAYVSDVEEFQSAWLMVAPSVREMILKMSPDVIHREQYIDFLLNRTFRCSVLCRAEAAVQAESPAWQRLKPLHVAGMFSETPAGTNAQGLAVMEFASGQYKVHISNPRATAVLRHIRSAWPAAIPFVELQSWTAKEWASMGGAQNAPEDLGMLLELYTRMGLLELWPRSTRSIAVAVGGLPRATRYARFQAVRDNSATSLRHESITLDIAFRQLIPLLDGTRDVKALTEELMRRKEHELGGNWPAKSPEHLQQMVEGTLKLMAKSSLLVGDDSN